MDDKQLFIIFSIIVIVSLVIDFRGKYKKCISKAKNYFLMK